MTITQATPPVPPTPALTPGTPSASPTGVGVASATVITFQHATPPTGGVPPYTISWKFGDGTEGAGNSVAHVYALTGDFTVVATVTDSKATVATSSVPVQIRDITARWTAVINGAGLDNDRINLIQNATAVSSTINSTNNFGLGSGVGAVANPRSLNVGIAFDTLPAPPALPPNPFVVSYRGTLNETLLTWTGTVTGYPGCPCTFVATRPSNTGSSTGTNQN